ncbi:hypothetical protein RQP46_000649 [Phenoliferia psychrophenolica]
MSTRSLKAISLVTLTVQNSLLTILLHYSRINAGPNETYSAASAVLLNELLKFCVSFSVATYNTVHTLTPAPYSGLPSEDNDVADEKRRRAYTGPGDVWELGKVQQALETMRRGVFSSDCWKLAIPACLYVVQNNLQFVAASNLDVPTFQVTYNLKILTTALFSVIMLKRRLSAKKWVALSLLAMGVGIVQLQSTAATGAGAKKHAAGEMNQAKGLAAVAAACMTSGLAGVYFEMVLKGSKTDLWIRNIQLSVFSLFPALVPVVLPRLSYALSSSRTSDPPQAVFAFFGFWAWAVVLCQVVGGLVTALVIKYADNLLKGFATALAIVFSFVAGIVLFEFHITLAFVVGTAVVVGATVLYNQPDPRAAPLPQPASSKSSTPPLSHYTNHPPVYHSGNSSPILRSRSTSPTRGGGVAAGVPGPYRRSPQTDGCLTPDLLTTTFERIESHTVQMPVAEYQFSDTRSLANGSGNETRKLHRGDQSPVP